MTLALIRVQLVVESLEAAAEHVGRAALVALEVFERCENEGAFNLLESRPYWHVDLIAGPGGAFAIAQRRLLAAQCARRRPKAARDIFVSSCGHTL